MEIRLTQEDIAKFQERVNDPATSADEKEMLAALVKFAGSQKGSLESGGGDWIFSWM
jgi:hypothetical protein